MASAANKVKQLKARLAEAEQDLVDKTLASEDKNDSRTTLAGTVAVNVAHLESVTDDELDQPKATTTSVKGKERRWRSLLKDELDDEQLHLTVRDYFRKVK